MNLSLDLLNRHFTFFEVETHDAKRLERAVFRFLEWGGRDTVTQWHPDAETPEVNAISEHVAPLVLLAVVALHSFLKCLYFWVFGVHELVHHVVADLPRTVSVNDNVRPNQSHGSLHDTFDFVGP